MKDRKMSELNELLENISEKELRSIWHSIIKTKEYDTLARKTQIKNSAVESKNEFDSKLTNRQKHSGQVSEVAYAMVQSNEKMTEKEALVARLVGLAHDLGHTPFGHDGENFFKEKTGKDFSHAKYGAMLFGKMFHKIIEKKNPKTGEYIFKGENRESLEAIKKHIEASLIIGDYIKTGIDLHQEGYYIFELDREMEKLQKEYKDEDGKFIRYNERLDILEKALKNPCIHAGMLADTVSIMQSDVRDMMSTKNPFDTSKTIISLEDQIQVAKKIGFSTEDILMMQKQLLSGVNEINIEGLDEEQSLYKVIETLGKMNVNQIQNMMAKNIGKNGLNDEERFESIPDEYKILADDYKAKYEQFKGVKLTDKEWKQIREEELPKQQQLLKEKNPLLCLTYEIQNELMYGKILNKNNIKILNNDLDRNKAMFSRIYDYLYKIGMAKTSELTDQKEIALKQEMNEMYKSKQYPKHLGEMGRDRRISKSQIIKNLVIFKMQQMGNLDLKDFYNQHIAEQENSILTQIELMEEQGKSEDEILQQLGGANQIAYSDFKRRDAKKIQDIENLRSSNTDEEIALKLGMEKRDFEELTTQGKSSLKRYLEYRMTFDEIPVIADKSIDFSLESNLVNEKSILDDIKTFDMVAEMHDQKSEQFFEDKESGKYNITDFEKLFKTRRRENIARVTNETIQEVRSSEQTKEDIAVGEER